MARYPREDYTSIGILLKKELAGDYHLLGNYVSSEYDKTTFGNMIIQKGLEHEDFKELLNEAREHQKKLESIKSKKNGGEEL